MHKILLFFLYLFLPTFAFATTCDLDNSGTTCISYNGCYLDGGGFNGYTCEYCPSHYYNNSTTNSTSCLSCENYNFDMMNTGKVWDSSDNSEGNTECPWKCTNNYYKTGDSCTHCPSNSTTDSSGATSINDCKCNSGYYMGGNNNTCLSCPEHAECVLTGLTYTTITCTHDYSPVINSQQHTVTCVRSCTDAHATIGSDNMCHCNSGYYGMPTYRDTICTKCPAGTTSNSGSTTISACHMTANTNFCVSDSNNCMNLLNFGSSTAFDNTNMVIR